MDAGKCQGREESLIESIQAEPHLTLPRDARAPPSPRKRGEGLCSTNPLHPFGGEGASEASG